MLTYKFIFADKLYYVNIIKSHISKYRKMYLNKISVYLNVYVLSEGKEVDVMCVFDYIIIIMIIFASKISQFMDLLLNIMKLEKLKIFDMFMWVDVLIEHCLMFRAYDDLGEASSALKIFKFL